MSKDSVDVSDPPNGADPVRVTVDPGLIRIRLQRPPVNALTVEIIDQLRVTVAAIRDDPRPVILCGMPRVFSAGFDVKAPAAYPDVAGSAAIAFLETLRAHPGPVIAAVDGAAVGLGLLIAASADILVTSRNASFRMPEVVLGIASDVDGLRRVLPELWVRRLCLSGQQFTAQEMHLEAAGALVCEPGECELTADSVALHLNGLQPRFVRDAKQQLRR